MAERTRPFSSSVSVIFFNMASNLVLISVFEDDDDVTKSSCLRGDGTSGAVEGAGAVVDGVASGGGMVFCFFCIGADASRLDKLVTSVLAFSLSELTGRCMSCEGDSITVDVGAAVVVVVGLMTVFGDDEAYFSG